MYAPDPRPAHHQFLHSGFCRPVFSMLRLLHLYVSLPSLQFLSLGSVRYGSGERLRYAAMWRFRGWFTSLLFSTTRIQYTMYDLLMNVREGRTRCSEYLLFVFLGFESELPSFCLTLRQIFACH